MKALGGSQTAVTMAIVVAFMTATAGLARGFKVSSNFARGRLFQQSACSVRSVGSVGSVRLLSAFVSPEGVSKEANQGNQVVNQGNQVANQANQVANQGNLTEDEEVEQAAQLALGISGKLGTAREFGGLAFLDTSCLEEGGHRVVFVLGGPGAGKGTQSERVVATYKCAHLSVGELLRAGAERSDYPHAALVKECLVQGSIVPVELSLGLLRAAMDDQARHPDFGARVFLVDGFPRNFDNLQGWMRHMPSYASVLGALVYDCPLSVLEARILHRAKSSGRSDDNLDSARRRFRTFQHHTQPVVQALHRVQQLQARANQTATPLNVVNIDAEGTVDQVWQTTKAAMDSYIKHDVLTANIHLLEAIEAGDANKFIHLCDDQFVQELKHAATSQTTTTTDQHQEQHHHNQTNTALTSSDIDQIFQMYEGPAKEFATKITKAKIDIHDGTKAVVSYNRTMKEKGSENTIQVREIRAWQHGPKGWKCIHFSRRVTKE